MKKRILLIVLALLMLVPNVGFASNQDVKLWIDGSYVESDVEPFIQDSRTMVPIRVISESLGFKVLWGESEQKVIIYAPGEENTGNSLMLIIGDKNAYFDVDDIITMDVAPKIINSRTFVPLRFIAEAFNMNVDWDQNNWTAIVGDGYVAPTNSKIPTNITKFRINRVVDGDTVKITYNGREESLRLIGIDTPESVHSDGSKNTSQGLTASEFTKIYLENKEVYVEFDVQQRDHYGRLLGYVWLADGVLFNNLLLEKGMAKVTTYPPNVKYVDLFTQTQLTARNNKVGFWNDLFVETSPPTAPIVDNKHDNLTVSPYSDRLIKGNISSSGEKIFHAPGQRDYKKTVIDESKGERWFATESEAINAGWRKAKR